MDEAHKSVEQLSEELNQLRRHCNADRWRRLAEAMPQLVWTADGDGHVDYVNNRHDRFLGLRKDPEGVWQWTAMIHPIWRRPSKRCAKVVKIC
jgi:PAS domain-containing protein